MKLQITRQLTSQEQAQVARFVRFQQTERKLAAQAKAAAKHRDFETVKRIGEQLRSLQAEMLAA